MSRFSYPTTRTLTDLRGKGGVIRLKILRELSVRVNPLRRDNEHRLSFSSAGAWWDVSAWVSPEYGSRRAPSYWRFAVPVILVKGQPERMKHLIDRILRSRRKKTAVQERELEP